jgi:hypothetical protein
MAFSRSGLARLGSSNSDAGAVWVYKTADTVATVNTADYFLPAINEIKLNDIIFVTSSTGGTPVITINYCNANNGTSIDVTDGLVVTATDSD